MNSRCSLWLLCVCCVGLAGCANWQNRAQLNGAPGSAATLNAPAAPAGPLLSPPGTSVGMPPPPVAPAPSDPFLTTPPPGERLDLSAVAPTAAPVRETSREAVPDKLYNMSKSSGSSKRVASASSASSGKASTISRLAEKADSSEKSKDAKPAKKESTSAERPSTLERLAREAGTASREVAEQSPSSLPKPSKAEAPIRSTSASSSSAPATSRISEPVPLDTTLLAQPIRKGAGDDVKDTEQESKGPQSRVIPDSKLFNGNHKPAIYPVSNPAVEEQIDITQFS